MQTFKDIASVRQKLQEHKEQGQSIAFVPTMGNLHQGHLSLVEKAKQLADVVIVSIFVNPLQFGAGEDLDSYPRTLQDDQQKLTSLATNYLFTPNNEMMYPEGMDSHSKVCTPELGNYYCGASRPGHFDGVTTVVNILFNIIQPDIAVFGEKDFQQLAIIRKMTTDLHMPITIIGCPTARSTTGLALSSRNQYLSDDEKAKASLLYQQLQKTQIAICNEPQFINKHLNDAKNILTEAGFAIDYFDLACAKSLRPYDNQANEVVLLAAAKLGTTRLIDNISFSLNT